MHLIKKGYKMKIMDCTRKEFLTLLEDFMQDNLMEALDLIDVERFLEETFEFGGDLNEIY